MCSCMTGFVETGGLLKVFYDVIIVRKEERMELSLVVLTPDFFSISRTKFSKWGRVVTP